MAEEQKKGELDADTEVVSTITSHRPGYIDKDLERVVRLQTDKPLKRSLMPFDGVRMVQKALESNNFEFSDRTRVAFDNLRKTHNDGVFDAYTEDILKARSSGNVTGLPDAYARGRSHLVGYPLSWISILSMISMKGLSKKPKHKS